jgi:hypothetical protein
MNLSGEHAAQFAEDRLYVLADGFRQKLRADLITKYPAYGGSFSDREIALKKVRGQASGCEE